MYKIYNPLDGETVYDIAIKLYKDARGVNVLISLNSLDLNSDSYFGQPMVYDDSIVFKREIFAIDTPKPSRADWPIQFGQSIFDLALQLYGDVNNLGQVLSRLLSVEDPAALMSISTDETNNNLALTLFSKTIIATSLSGTQQDRNFFILKQDGSYILRQDSGKIIIDG